MEKKLRTFKSNNWVTAETAGLLESKDLAQLLYTMIMELNVLTRIGFSKKTREGTYHIEELYDVVKTNFAGLCDDKCFEANGYKRAPKWKHVVRCALDVLKEQEVIIKLPRRGYWMF